MKIGILTFHWATNYGAVLQCYALQSFLDAKGHDVKIINYKPHRYDDNIFTCLRYRKFLHFRDYLNNRKNDYRMNLTNNGDELYQGDIFYFTIINDKERLDFCKNNYYKLNIL